MEKLNTGAKNLGLHFNPGQLEQFDIYYQELVDWNKRLNLTAITSYEEVQIKHFLDSLTVTLALQQHIYNNVELRLIDVGTGAGPLSSAARLPSCPRFRAIPPPGCRFRRFRCAPRRA